MPAAGAAPLAAADALLPACGALQLLPPWPLLCLREQDWQSAEFLHWNFKSRQDSLTLPWYFPTKCYPGCEDGHSITGQEAVVS